MKVSYPWRLACHAYRRQDGRPTRYHQSSNYFESRCGRGFGERAAGPYDRGYGTAARGKGMLFLLTTQPIWVSGTILIGLTTVLAMLGPYVVRRHVALERLTTNNEVAGFKFATV